MSGAIEAVIENGAACPECGKGYMVARMITPNWDHMGFSEVRYFCTECPVAYVLTKDDRFI